MGKIGLSLTNGTSTVKNLITTLQESSIEPGTLIWDRGNVSKENIDIVEATGWKLICGIPKTSSKVRDIIKRTEIKFSWDTLARASKAGHIYAVKTKCPLYGKERMLTVYTNHERGTKDMNSRNEALVSIDDALRDLERSSSKRSERELHAAIRSIVGEYGRFISTKVSRKSTGPRITWKFNSREISKAEISDGRYLLFSSDEGLSEKEVVNQYLEKDFIEKVFRTLKTTEEIEPVRHRLEERVRAYIFVCVLAYRLLAYLQYKLALASKEHDTWEKADSLLEDLEHVERVQVKLGHQVKSWYLNLPKGAEKTLESIGMAELFTETSGIDLSDVGGKS